MYNRIRAQILKFMRVPAEPEPPFGGPGSVRTFRAGRNYYYVRLVRWGVGQIGAAVGILFSIGFLMKFTADVESYHARQANTATVPVAEARTFADLVPKGSPAAPAQTSPSTAEVSGVDTAPAPAEINEAAPTPPTTKKSRRARNSRDGYPVIVSRTPRWGVRLMNLGELLGIGLFVLQIPFTFIAARLEYELRWYIVTDRSLRIRAGLVSLQESTMSFANIQQVEVRQGPFQRLLGIADVRVQSAGGGGGGPKGAHVEDSLHTGVFHGVENAHEIRDLILERLKAFRETGLGDPDDAHASASAARIAPADAPLIGATSTAAPALQAGGDALVAAREVLVEARALRRALS